MKVDIKIANGKWTANGKTYSELNEKEKQFMDQFFKEVKIKSINHENN